MASDDIRTVAEVGEFGLIERLVQALPPAVREHGLRLGIGDDAAIWRPAPHHDLVVTTDTLVEQVHFRLDWTDWASLGHKALAVNLSDLAAMGAMPRLAVLTLGLRGTERVSDLEVFYRALGDLAARDRLAIAGGDIVRSPTALMICVTAIGEVPTDGALTRGGARPGDQIAVSGTLGAAAAGLRLLAAREREDATSTATGGLLLAAHLRPEPRLALGQVLRQHRATAAMDLSDGLLGDLPKLLAAGGVRASLDLAAIPVAAAVRANFPEQWEELALRGGEDYELLFTAPSPAMDVIREAAAATGATVSPIGMIEAASPDRVGEIRLVRPRAGESAVVSPGAFDHFRGNGR